MGVGNIPIVHPSPFRVQVIHSWVGLIRILQPAAIRIYCTTSWWLQGKQQKYIVHVILPGIWLAHISLAYILCCGESWLDPIFAEALCGLIERNAVFIQPRHSQPQRKVHLSVFCSIYIHPHFNCDQWPFSVPFTTLTKLDLLFNTPQCFLLWRNELKQSKSHQEKQTRLEDENDPLDLSKNKGTTCICAVKNSHSQLQNINKLKCRVMNIDRKSGQGCAFYFKIWQRQKIKCLLSLNINKIWYNISKMYLVTVEL